jgi:glutathione S-transferase
MKLYDYGLSANCYAVRLMLGFLGISYERIPIELYPALEHLKPDFLKINPFGELPVLHDDGEAFLDTHAILLYLALRDSRTTSWYPTEHAATIGQVSMWLAFASRLDSSLGAARLHDAFFCDADVDKCRLDAHRYLGILDEHLWFEEQGSNDWLCGGSNPTVADIACFPHVVLSEEGGVSLLYYPAIRRWTDRFKRIPGFTLMAGVFDAAPLKSAETYREPSGATDDR